MSVIGISVEYRFVCVAKLNIPHLHFFCAVIMLFNFSTGDDGILNFEVLWWKKCLDVVGQFQTIGKKCCCFFLSATKKMKGKEVETTITIIPCVHIILCTNADVVSELKWWVTQAAREKQVFENVDAPGNFKSDVRKHFGFPCVKTWEKRNGNYITKSTMHNLQHLKFNFFFNKQQTTFSLNLLGFLILLHP